MTAYVTLSTATGEEMLTVSVDDGDPFALLTVRGMQVQLTRDESRRAADALRAASSRRPFEPGGRVA